MVRVLSHIVVTTLSAALLLGSPAFAGGGGGGGGKSKGGEAVSNRIKATFTLEDIEGGGEEEPVSEAGPRAVMLPTIAAPVFEDDRLHGYLFVSFQINVSESADPWKLREHIADVRDAVIRGTHERSIGVRSAIGGELDEVAAREVVVAATTGVLSDGGVESVEVLNYDVKYN